MGLTSISGDNGGGLPAGCDAFFGGASWVVSEVGEGIVEGAVCSVDAGNVTFTITGLPVGSKTFNLLAQVQMSGSTSVAERSKTLKETTITRGATSDSDGRGFKFISLDKPDVFTIKAIKETDSNGVDISGNFVLDNGQRDNYYGIGRLLPKQNVDMPAGNVFVRYQYFEHEPSVTGVGGQKCYFSATSYKNNSNAVGSLDGTGVTYETIPDYTKGNGQKVNLRDVLDFRPVAVLQHDFDSAGATLKANGHFNITFDSNGPDVAGTTPLIHLLPQPGGTVQADITYFLGRKDRLVANSSNLRGGRSATGSIDYIQGLPSFDPELPNLPNGAMPLYNVNLGGNTVNTKDITTEPYANKRFQMADIARLERRIDNLEYYTQLSLLETAAQNLQIQDSNGFDRFKNGFVVDNFTGHNIGDVGNNDYKVAIDYANGELRPTFHEDAISLVETDDDGTAIVADDRTAHNYQKTGDLITLPYTETTLIDQPYASKAINVNPFGVFTWVGAIELTPPGDEWKETERAPELVINNPNGSWDNLTKNSGNSGQLSEFPMSTVWNSWQDTWTGRPVETERRNVGTYRKRGGHGWRVMAKEEVTTAQQVSQTRTGIRAVAVPETVRTSVGDRVVSIAFVPFIRSRTLSFTATRLKPNTRVYPFFDNIDITSYVTPSGGALGGNLVTDANGKVEGTFAIPDPKTSSNPRWRTGQRLFRLTSSSTNSLTNANVETAANTEYVARGLLETVRETIISSREARVEMRSVTESQTITRTSTRTEERQVGYHDPLAQTFLIDDEGGVFLTSIDVFFSTKDAAIPVTVQVRNVVNGYPGQKILPFSEVTLNPSAVNTSTDGTTATKFTFASPVYIQSNVEYCFVVMANSQDYNAYVARIGETSLDTNRTISAQPYAGVLFKSQNGMTWSAEQNEDMKFTLRRAEFSNVTGEVTLTNDSLGTRTLKQNALRTTNGSKVIRVFHPNHGMHGTSNNVTIAGVPSGTYNGIAHSDINGTYTSISNVTLDSYDITSGSSSNATATGDIGGAAVTATQNRIFDVLNLGGIQTVTLPDTNIDYYVRTTTGRSVHGSETEFTLTSSTNKLAVINNDNIAFTAPQMVASDINATNESISGGKSFYTILELTTTNTKLSPVLDTQRMSAFTIQNRLNSPSSSNTPSFVSDTANTGTSSAAVYCTKPVLLENNSKALDIRLTANIRATSEVEMYFRVSTDGDKLDELSWTPFNSDGSSDSSIVPAEDDTTFKEYKYTASDINDFTSFQLKVVMKGTISSYPPVLRDLRGIALAV